jgi:acetyltransferase-like isoleucine patch superfamily enzyme
MMSGWYQRTLRRIAYLAPGGFSLRPTLHKWRGVRIGKNVWISQHVYIDEIHPEAISIGDNVTIGIRASLIAHMYWGSAKGKDSAGPITIESDVFIGPHCVILPGVHIGKGSVIRAGTVVSRDVGPGLLVGNAGVQTLAEVTVPLTPGHSYTEFVSGLRPVRNKGSYRENG